MERRGQTTLDFAIGVGVFFIVVAFALTAVPTVFEPLDRSIQSETVTADRLATRIAEEGLGSADEPYIADRGCTFAFFNDETDDGDFETGLDTDAGHPGTLDDCPYTDGPLADRFGLPERTNVQVRLVRDLVVEEADNPDADGDDANFGEAGDDGSDQDDGTVETLCYDFNSDRVIEGPSVGGNQCDTTGGDDDLLFAVGDDPEGVPSTSVGRRTVRVEGGFADGTGDARLIVEVW